MQIRDWTRTRKYLDVLKGTDWKKELLVKKTIMNVQKKKDSRWSQRRYAKHLSRSHSQISDDLTLAEALEKYPQLSECDNKNHAREKLRLIRNRELNPLNADGDRAQPFRKEEELRDFLARNWDSTPLAASWELVRPEYPTLVGPIDLLAHHKTEKKWLVIELKISKPSDSVIGQILRYVGWVKLNLARREDEKVEGLIIAPGIDENAFCSLVDLKDMSVKSYRLKDKAIQLEGLDEVSLQVLMARILETPVMKDFLEAEKKGHKPDPRIIQLVQACS
jgi:RecB family endonuclease NucS